MSIIFHDTITPDLSSYSRANAAATLSRLVGAFIIAKARKQAAESGTFRAAQNLRKAGYPLALAVSILRVRQQ